MSFNRDDLSHFLLSTTLISASLNLFLVLSEQGAWIDGWRVDYLIPKLFLAQFFLSFFLLEEAWYQRKKIVAFLQKNFLSLSFFIFIFALQLASTEQPLIGLWQALTWFSILLFALIVRQKINRSSVTKDLALRLFFLIIIGQSFLAFWQFFGQKNFLPYQFLGESNFQASSNLAKFHFFGLTRIAPYGTMSHPNILAGSLAILASYLWTQTQGLKWWSKRAKIAIFFTWLVVFMTQSLSAFLFLAIYFLDRKRQQKTKEVFSFKNKRFFLFLLPLIIFPLFLYLISSWGTESLSISRRVNLNQAAWKMWLERPFFGVGWGQFTLHLKRFWPENFFTQPAHNVFWLVLSELGILGGLCYFFLLLKLIVQKSERGFFTFLPWFILLALDHYFWTSFWGILVFCLLF